VPSVKAPPAHAPAQRFLFVAPQGLGDALEATPAIAAVKAARPDVPIDVAVLRPGPRELFEGLPHLVDRVIYLPFWEAGRRAFVAALVRRARLGRYDASFLMYPAARFEYQVLPVALGARRRYAHRYFDPSLRNGLWLSTDLVAVRAGHNVERNLDLIRAAGFAPAAPVSYEVPRAWRADEARNSDVLAVHVGNIAHDGLEARRWPAAYFTDLIVRMRARGMRAFILSGPSERELSRDVAAASNADGLVELPLADAARFLSTCTALVANDGGIAHLAAGVGTPVLAVFGPTPLDFAPFGRTAIGFRPSPCPPCFDPRLLNTHCALGIDYACLKRDASVDRVERALCDLLETQAASAPSALQAPSP
jgi:heptosyltransferase-2